MMLRSVLMMAVCAGRLHREYGGLGKSLTTCAVSLRIVVVYYGILVVWFWLIPLRRCPYLTQTLFLALSANQRPPKFFPRLLITLAVPDVAQKPTKSSVSIHRY
jgi:hypothetical protein